MALSNGNEGENGKAINLKLVAEQGRKIDEGKISSPNFVVRVKDDKGEYALSDEKYNQVKGTIVSIKSSHNGKSGKDEVKGFKLHLKDGEESYFIDTTMTNASKDIANHCLANIGTYVIISVYTNKANYPASVVKDKDGKHTSTSQPYNELNRDQLWNDIKAQEDIKSETVSASDESMEAIADDIF